MAASTGGRSWRGGGREGLGGSTLATPLMAVLEQDTLGRIYTGPTAPGPAQPSHIEESKGAEKPLVVFFVVTSTFNQAVFYFGLRNHHILEQI